MKELAINGGEPVFKKKIGYGHLYIDDADIQAVVDVLKSDFLTTGPKIDEAEAKLCEITGAKHAVLIANGTAALHAAAFAAEIGPGDEVITTPITFAASANCAFYCGGRPVFADIVPETTILIRRILNGRSPKRPGLLLPWILQVRQLKLTGYVKSVTGTISSS